MRHNINSSIFIYTFQELEDKINTQVESGDYMKNIEKIKLNLFTLKSKHNLNSITAFFTDYLSSYFNADHTPKEEYFECKGCPICHAEKKTPVYTIDKFSYFECDSCKGIYTDPFIKETYINMMYSSGVYNEYQQKLVHNSSGLRKDLLDKRKIAQIENHQPKKGKLLDVGCGQGSFLKSCKDGGWQVKGVDPSLNAAVKAKELYGFDVITSRFEDLSEEEKYDCVTLWGVLEHVLTPLDILNKASALCNKNAIVQFEVPSSDCFLKKYLEKYSFLPTRYIESGRHNIFFSRKSIEWMLEQAGLELVEIESNGLDIQTILMEEFDESVTEKLLNIQDLINDMLLGDHYRVFARKI